jgi:AcrR family transcriptional regulator
MGKNGSGPRNVAEAAASRPRPILTEEKIVQAAVDIAEVDGIARMTMRAIGERLGADPTAVYRYFPKKADLLAAMADRLFSALPIEAPERPWRQRIERSMRAARQLYRDHPSLTTLLATSDETLEGLVRINESTMTALVDAGLDARRAALFHQVLVSAVLGHAVVDSSWAVDDGEERDAVRRAYSALPPQSFPTLVAHSEYLFPELDDVFELTMQLILDAIETAAATCSTDQ